MHRRPGACLEGPDADDVRFFYAPFSSLLSREVEPRRKHHLRNLESLTPSKQGDLFEPRTEATGMKSERKAVETIKETKIRMTLSTPRSLG